MSTGPQTPGPSWSGQPGPQFSGSQHSGPQHSGPQHSGPQYSGPHYAGPPQPDQQAWPGSGAPVPGRPPRPRKRLSAKWFLLPGVLTLITVLLGVGFFLALSRAVTTVHATIEPDGQWHEVTVPAGEELALWRPQYSATQCRLQAGDGSSIEQDFVGFGTSKTRSGRTWYMMSTFDSGDGRLSVACDGDEPAEVAPNLLQADGLPLSMLLGFGAFAFGFFAFVSFMVVLIVFLIRRQPSR